MRSIRRVAALAALAACSSSATTPEPSASVLVANDGQLKLTVSDAPARPGVLFITGTVVGGQSMVTVSSTRYGSLCSTAISAHADVASGRIRLHVTYAERTTLCTADIRAITYRAEIGKLAAGVYDVEVIHTTPEGTTSTVMTRRITVA